MKHLTKQSVRFSIAGICLVLIFSSCRKDKAYPDPVEILNTKQIFISGNDTLRYQLLSPENFQTGKKYPILLFCHGAQQRGNDNESQLADFPKFMLSHFGGNLFPCYIIAPQVPLQQQWVNVPWTDSSETKPDKISTVEMMTVKLLDSLTNAIAADTNRIYVTGLSMGGFATWDLISRYPKKFAAAVPIAGGGNESQADKLIHIPIWAFHGALDNVVLPCRSINMVNAVNNAGGNARLTIYPNEGHGSWNEAYADPELFRWLFAQSK